MTTHVAEFDNEDLELLSAYLDDVLTDGERAQLEQRLAQDPTLQQTLNELHITVNLLQDLPSVIPPRSFTIDPATVQTGQGWLRVAAWLRLGSALTAIVFALTLTFEFAFFGNTPTGFEETANEAPAPEIAVEEAAEETAGDTMIEKEADLAAGSVAESPAATANEREAVGAIASDDLQNGEANGSAQDELIAPLESQPQPEERFAAPPQVQAPSLDGGEALVGEEESIVQQPPEIEQTPVSQPIAPLRIVQILLMVFAIGLGAGSWWMVRRGHQ